MNIADEAALLERGRALADRELAGNARLPDRAQLGAIGFADLREALARMYLRGIMAMLSAS